MSIVHKLARSLPFAWKTRLIDVIAPRRQGIGPILRSMDRNAKVVLDIGANIGDVSLSMLYYFPQATVYSFEPCSDTFHALTTNISKAGYSDRSRPFQLGFFDAETKGTLNVTSFHGANSLMDISKEYSSMNPHIRNLRTESISLVKLDDFAAQNGIEHIDLVKIDVEGVEQQILRGGRDTFSSKVDTVILEISFVRHPRESGEFMRLFGLMHEYGFAPARIFDVEHDADERDWKLAQFDCVFRKYRPSGPDARGTSAK